MKVWNSLCYTDEDVALLRRMFGEYYSAKDIALALGRSKASVDQKVHKLGLKRNVKIVQLVTLYGLDVLEAGHDPVAIKAWVAEKSKEARALKKQQQAERRQRALEGLKADIELGHCKKWAIKEAFTAGAPIIHIAAMLGMGRWSVTRIINQRNSP